MHQNHKNTNDRNEKDDIKNLQTIFLEILDFHVKMADMKRDPSPLCVLGGVWIGGLISIISGSVN